MLLLLRLTGRQNVLRWSLGRLGPLSSDREVISVLDGDTLGHMVDLVDAHEPLSEFEHVVAKRDDDELRVFGAFLDISCHDRHLITDTARLAF